MSKIKMRSLFRTTQLKRCKNVVALNANFAASQSIFVIGFTVFISIGWTMYLKIVY